MERLVLRFVCKISFHLSAVSLSLSTLFTSKEKCRPGDYPAKRLSAEAPKWSARPAWSFPMAILSASAFDPFS